jgi:Uma2 family endonuclease
MSRHNPSGGSAKTIADKDQAQKPLLTVCDGSRSVNLPAWVVDLESFRRWADSDDFPEDARGWYLKGQVWVDMSKEQIYTHVQAKTEFIVVLGGLVRAGDLGLFLADGAFLTHVDADISGIPDAVFASKKTLRAGRVRALEGMETGHVELEGSPDMVLEVVSESSVKKDTIILRQAYWEAGIREYWLVDVRGEPAKFDLLKHSAKGYTHARNQDGWLKSSVFGKAFQLAQKKNVVGHTEFRLAVRC